MVSMCLYSTSILALSIYSIVEVATNHHIAPQIRMTIEDAISFWKVNSNNGFKHLEQTLAIPKEVTIAIYCIQAGSSSWVATFLLYLIVLHIFLSNNCHSL